MTILPIGVRSRVARRLRGRVSSANLRALVHALCDDSEVIRKASLDSLISSEAAGATVLIEEADSDSTLMRTQIANALGRFGGSSHVIRALTHLLRDLSPSVRTAAANSLGEIGVPAASAVVLLKKLAKGNDLNTTVASVKALGRIDVGASSSSLPMLITLIVHTDRSIRVAVIEAIRNLIDSGKVDLETFQLTSQLLPLIQHRDPGLREVAAKMLAAIGPGAVDVIPQLIPLTQDLSVTVRLAAVNSLSSIAPGDPRTFSVFITMTQDKEWSIREAATRGFIGFGPAAKNAVPRLKVLLTDEYVRVRIAAIDAIASIGHSARYLLSDLYVRLFDTHADTRQAAMTGFRKMAASSKEFLPILVQELQSNDESRRLTSIEVIKEFGDHAAKLVPYVINCENDSSPAIRRAVASLSGQIVSDR